VRAVLSAARSEPASHAPQAATQLDRIKAYRRARPKVDAA
jgi:hypothetical protein